MTCPHCAPLAEKVRIYERELALRSLDFRIAAVMLRVGVSPTQARILLRLYEGGGKPVLERHLHACLTAGAKAAVRVYIYQIRQIVGDNWIETHKNPKGTGYSGYALTARGLAGVLGALEPPELQDARG